MAINNLSGNFQPPSGANGRNLPAQSEREPSTNVQSSDKGVQTVTNLEPNSTSPKEVAINQKPTEKQEDVFLQLEEFKSFNQSIDRSLQFKVDEELGVTIVRVIDKQTDELIRQFPPEELINLSKRLKELNDEGKASSGVLLKEKV
ncbi:MAG: flagellar protein FlaG [Kangiellaceae bacterium]|nr:flagellar protein FlaG [Kangiellaceae bacterium]